MKAISFLEYYKSLNEESLGATNMLCDLDSYCILISQPFSFNKVVELFEGFEIDKKYLKYNLIRFSTDGITIFVDMNYNAGLASELWTSDIIPKTIDEFIVLCNNLNIELNWK
jgi:hypothetical protein